MKVAFKTLGCRLNQYETDALVTDFYIGGYEIVPFTHNADVYIVNTCTVTNQSDQKSKSYINQALRKHHGAITVVTGCMVNNKKEYLENRKDITYVVENTKKSSIFSLVDGHVKGEIIHPQDIKQDLFNFSVAQKSFHTRSMIKIQDGCNNCCSYCIVPKVRGKATSRPVKNIIENVKQVLDYGYKEIVLTGVNISRYDFDGVNFEDLIERILNIEGDFRLRISSIEPEGFGDKFIQLFQHPKLCPHLHLCLQSGSDRILLQMRRQYNINGFCTFIDSFRDLYPDFNFTTDIIVGFPGETEDDFKQSCRISEEIGFSHIHTFKYSLRKGTRAESLEGHIPENIKKDRSEIIRKISDKNKIKYRKSLLEKQQKVLVEKINKGIAKGYGQHYVPIEFTAGNYTKNTFVDVKLSGISNENEYFLLGEVENYHLK